MKFYYAVAYRWGYTNAHQYVVSVGNELGKVILDATKEQSDRGGKYGIAVYEHGTDELLNYFPSFFDEKQPRLSARIYAIDAIGAAVLAAAESGVIFVPDPNRPGYNKCEQVEMPSWLTDMVKKHTATAEAIGDGHAEESPLDFA